MSRALVGRTFLKRYRVDAFLGSGGMAEVYRVWDLERRTPLAMKVLRTDLAENESVMKLFRREAIALQKLAHRNIPTFYGLYNSSDELDLTFILVGLIDGPSLEDVLKGQKTLPLEDVLIYVKAVASALGYAHLNRVVHCDVKPGNVLIDGGGNIYLTDFGIARHAESTNTTIAEAGTAAYMAPEQALMEPVSARTDVYALGVLVFKMLTGKTPFHDMGAKTDEKGTTPRERVLYGQVHLPPPDPREINPAVSPAAAAVIIKALNKDAASRYQDASELFEALCQAAGVSAEAVPERLDPAKLPERTAAAEAGEEDQGGAGGFIRRHVALVAGGGFVAVVTLALAVGFLLLRKPPQTPGTPDGSQTPSAETASPIPAATATPAGPTVPPPTATPSPTPTPEGLTGDNYQRFQPIYQWDVNDIARVNGIAISSTTRRVGLLTQSYPEAYGVEVRDLEGNLVWKKPIDSKAAYPAIAFSPDGSLVAAGMDSGYIQLWNAETGASLGKLKAHDYAVRVVAFSPDGKILASGGSDGYARTWLVPSGMAHQQYDSATDVREVVFAPDSNTVAVSSNVVFIWDANSTDLEVERLWDTTGQTRDISEIAFSADGQRVAAYGEWFNSGNGRWRPRILLWSYPGAPTSPTLIPRNEAVEDLTFSADGRLLVGVYKDKGKLFIVDPVTREDIGVRDLGPKLLLSYAPDLSMFAILSTRTSVAVWGIQP